MHGYYDLNAFRSCIWDMEDGIDRVVKTGKKLHSKLVQQLSQSRKEGKIRLVGSSNPERLTCIIDPCAPDDTAICDFDVKVILSGLKGNHQRTRILEEMFPEGQTCEAYGRVDRRSVFEGFPVECSVVLPTEEKECEPCVYDTNHARGLNADQIMAIRTLKLWLHRCGIYGGFHGGLNGVAAEELIKRRGGFTETLEWMYKHLERSQPLVLEFPIDKRNLLENLTPDVLRRLETQLGIFMKDWKVPSNPYSFDRWEREHPSNLNLSLISPSMNPHEVYQKIISFAHKAKPEEGGEYCSAMILPGVGQQRCFISFEEPLPRERERVRGNFLRRWNAFNRGEDSD